MTNQTMFRTNQARLEGGKVGSVRPLRLGTPSAISLGAEPGETFRVRCGEPSPLIFLHYMRISIRPHFGLSRYEGVHSCK